MSEISETDIANGVPLYREFYQERDPFRRFDYKESYNKYMKTMLKKYDFFDVWAMHNEIERRVVCGPSYGTQTSIIPVIIVGSLAIVMMTAMILTELWSREKV